MNNEYSNNKNLRTSKNHKSIIIAELILSILHFIPSFLIVGLGIALNFILLMVGSGGSKISDTSGFYAGIKVISIFSIIPTIVTLILFILTIISTVKFFKGKNNRIYELIVCIGFAIIDILFLTNLIGNVSILLNILLCISVIVFILGFIISMKGTSQNE